MCVWPGSQGLFGKYHQVLAVLESPQTRERERARFTPGRIMGVTEMGCVRASGTTACRYWTLFPGPLPRTSKGRVFVIFPVPRAVDAPRATPHPRVRTAGRNVAMSAHASAHQVWMPCRYVSRFFQQPCGGPVEIGKQLRERYCTAGRAFEAADHTQCCWVDTLDKPDITLNLPVLTGISMDCAVDHRTN